MSIDTIRIRGARTHNLRNVDIDIPRNRLVVITGVSGSGKSSLAFDTLLAEARRQYIDSLSVYARQFFEQLERPDVDRIDGLQPAVAVDQRQGTHSPRSTVGTVTEAYDFLRLLYARAGDLTCAACGAAISQQSPEEVRQVIEQLPPATKAMLLAPLVRGRRGKHAEAIEQVRKAGLVRVRIDGETYPIEDAPELEPRKNHTIEAVVDRIVLREGVEPRLAESVRLALRHGDGVLVLAYQTPDDKAAGGWKERVFNTRYACADCGTGVAEIEPRTFSFNTPYGACPECDGLGAVEARGDVYPCEACGGSRLRPEARACRVAGRGIDEIVRMPVVDALEFFRELDPPEDRRPIAEPIVREIVRRLEFLVRAGVGYLSLDRGADTLSGGELQRVRLASAIGSGLVGVMYLLDEPSVGLHPADNDRLLAALRDLQAEGNSVIVVEHDEAMMRAADWLIDVGPGAGARGGAIVAEGTPEQVTGCEASVTGAYLSGRRRVWDAEKGDASEAAPAVAWLELSGATLHNLREVDLAVPLGKLTCVTGVSGSGKSSLVIETLAAALARRLHGATQRGGPYRGIKGLGAVDRAVVVDQSAIGRSPRSNPATFVGAFDEIRKVFAKTKIARQRGWKAGRFSFNTKGGRCEACQGQGATRLEMNFLPDLFVPCEVCRGARFERSTLAVRFHGKNIADVLNLCIDDAAALFENVAPVHRLIAPLVDVGLGYLRLGQPSNTLSGGEAQRVKLAGELGATSSNTNAGHTFYILDEPTTGLHAEDIRRLIGVLRKLVDAGNTVLVIEHHTGVMQASDWLIDMGPGGGAAGGRIVAAGTPIEVARCPESITAKWLQEPS
ncbi:UvrABC system protein A [Pirellulimonas nuda]|uniref:UvrABC system protein A n=1 Tax=Pirellulimonas nuda TaxID=2528009 RepID=A0A518DHY5_9BACT|nr:excinuclease ABC subunit UvrA [Pirellulimonas nuda]QDU91093.1 UvrABC system protein A [Pirellulimonas nuda]